MPESDLADRLDAVERALTDDDTDLTDVRDRAALTADIDRLEARIADLEATVEELEAAVDAVRGYAGNVRAVNRDVERRASAALAKAEALETALAGTGQDPPRSVADTGRSASSPDRAGQSDPTTTSREGSRGEQRDGTQAGENGERVSNFDGTDDSRQWETGRRRPAGSADDQPDRVDEAEEAGSTDRGTGQTEEFIERVRDAL